MRSTTTTAARKRSGRFTSRLMVLVCVGACVDVDPAEYRCDPLGRCPDGYTCVDGLCQTTGSVVHDAGSIEAATPDQSVADRATAGDVVAGDALGRRDATAGDRVGLDARAADTAASDTWIADAATPDTAPTDAAVPDTSSPDHAGPDTSSPDHAGPDTSSPDRAGPDMSSPDHAGPDTSSPDHAIPDASVPDHALPDSSAEVDSAVAGSCLFDPERVYAIGTMQEGLGAVNVVVDLATPNLPCAGFSGWPRDPQLGSSGELLFLGDAEAAGWSLVQHVPDLWSGAPATGTYPSSPADNDIILATPPCDTIGGLSVGPEPGQRWHGCYGGGWYTATGVSVFSCPLYPSLARDGEGAAQCRDSVIDAEGVEHDLALDDDLILARRRPGGGFWGVTCDVDHTCHRYRIATDGAVELDMDYPPLPESVRAYNTGDRSLYALDGQGRLYRVVIHQTDSDQAIVQLGEEGAAIVYDEATEPAARLHAPRLFSGP